MFDNECKSCDVSFDIISTHSKERIGTTLNIIFCCFCGKRLRA